MSSDSGTGEPTRGTADSSSVADVRQQTLDAACSSTDTGSEADSPSERAPDSPTPPDALSKAVSDSVSPPSTSRSDVAPHVTARFAPPSIERESAADRFRVVDLFSGAGGTSCGAWQAGGTLVAGVDADETALETHAANLPGEHIQHDLRTVDPEILPTTDIHYMHGSPPCPGFSSASGRRDPDDERNGLVWSFIEWCAAVGPTIATMENVAGMASITDHWMDRVIGAFDRAGYTARWRTLNAADYGVPQTRHRIFVVAVRDDASVPMPSRWFPRPTHAETPTTTLDGRALGKWRTVRDAIGDLSSATDGNVMTDQINETHQKEGRRPMQSLDGPSNTIRAGTPPGVVQNHEPQDHTDRAREKFAAIEPGSTDGAVNESRLAPDQPARTIVPGNGTPPVHYQGRIADAANVPDQTNLEEVVASPSNAITATAPYLSTGKRRRNERGKAVLTSENERRIRRLTVRECARLQSFPDWFTFSGAKNSQYKQVGNAVPPRLAQHIASHVHDLLRADG